MHTAKKNKINNFILNKLTLTIKEITKNRFPLNRSLS